jgi:hypothetical protein
MQVIDLNSELAVALETLLHAAEPDRTQIDVVLQADPLFSTKARVMRRDDEVHVVLRALHATEAWCHASSRVIIRPGRDMELQCGFSADLLAHASHQDLLLQDSATTALAQILGDVLPEQSFDRALIARWQSRRSWITQRLFQIEAEGLMPDRLKLIIRSSTPDQPSAHLALISKWTRLAKEQDFIGLIYQGEGRGSGSVRRKLDSCESIEAITQERLAIVTDLSGHEKLALLAGDESKYLELLSKPFTIYAQSGIGRSAFALPFPDGDAIGEVTESWHHLHSGHVHFANGDELRIWSGSVSWTPADDHPGLKINLDAGDGIVIERMANETRFKTVEVLDRHLRRAIEIMLLVDPEWPQKTLAKCTGSFDPTHPVIDGIDVPPRHQAFVGTVLSEPYRKARETAEAFAAWRDKRKTKEQAVADVPFTLPDGAIFGRRDCSKLKRLQETRFNTEFHRVVTISEPGAKRRKRALACLDSNARVRPVTPKHIANFKFPRLMDPNSLWLLPDVVIGFHSRDVIEAAFRVSFDLPGGALNPFLQAKAEIFGVETENPAIRIRVTKIDTDTGYTLRAFAALREAEYRTGGGWILQQGSSGIAFLTDPSGDHVHFRPSGIGWKSWLPKDERPLLAAAMSRLCAADPSRAARYVAALELEWARLAKDFPEK